MSSSVQVRLPQISGALPKTSTSTNSPKINASSRESSLLTDNEQRSRGRRTRGEYADNSPGTSLKKSRSSRDDKEPDFERKHLVPPGLSKQTSHSMTTKELTPIESLPVLLSPDSRNVTRTSISVTRSESPNFYFLPDLTVYHNNTRRGSRKNSLRMELPAKASSRRGSHISSVSNDSVYDQDGDAFVGLDARRSRNVRKSTDLLTPGAASGGIVLTSRRSSRKGSGADPDGDQEVFTERGYAFNARARRLERRKRLYARFRRLGHFLSVLFSLWRTHARRVRNFLESNVDLIDIEQPMDLLFDVTEYRADKQARVSSDTKRILMKRPEERTEEEIRYVQIALGNYPSIAEYPRSMTRQIAQRGWYEKYESRRVIIRQSHPSRCFYFILNGSVVVTRMEGSEISKTVCFLNRGESFGDLGLINNAPRQATVVSKEPVEFLVFGDEVYSDIFMSGGLKDASDPFLNSLSLFQGWPINLLAENQNVAFLNYFKRGSVLAYDSKCSDWIFIVKSGSAKILKKLRKVKPSELAAIRDKVPLKSDSADGGLEHEATINERLGEAERRWEGKSHSFRERLLHELDLQIALHPLTSHDAVSTTIDKVANVNSALSHDVISDENGVISAGGKDSHADRLSGPFITKAQGLPQHPPTIIIEEVPHDSTAVTPKSNHEHKTKTRKKSHIKKKKVSSTSENKTLSDELNERYLASFTEETDADVDPVFVRVRTLTKGGVFGLSEIVHDDQPSLSLVSNGAEFVVLHKKFYMDNVSKQLMISLRKLVSPYPSEEELQDFLQIYVDWEHNKSHVFQQAISHNHRKKINVHDARSTLELRQKVPQFV